MNAWRAAWLLSAKDWRVYIRDRTGLLLGLALPLVMVVVFGYLMQFMFGGSGGTPKVTLWVADADGSPASARLVEELRRADMLSVRPRVDEKAVAPELVRQKVADGEAHHALVIEGGYGEAMARSALPTLQVFGDPGRTMERNLVSIGVMQAFLAASEGKLWPQLMGRRLAEQGMEPASVERLVAAAGAMQGILHAFVGGAAGGDARVAGGAPEQAFDPSTFFTGLAPVAYEDVQPPARPKNLSYVLAQSISGVTVMMLLFGLMAASNTLIDERRQGTLRRLFSTAVPRGSILGGKFLFGFAVGLVQLVIVFTVAEVIFGVGTFRDPVTLLVLSVSWAACATGFGMVIATWAQTTKQAEGLATILILVMAALGGCWFPIQMAELPLFAEIVTRCTLTYWAMDGFQGMFWHQKTLADGSMQLAVGVQWGIAIAGALVARRLFARRYVSR